MNDAWSFALIVGIASWLIMEAWSALLIRHPMKRIFSDMPNQRSSHTQAIPRGAGLPLGLVGCLAIFAMPAFEDTLFVTKITLSIGFVILSTLGVIDDLWNISAKIRLATHFLVAVITVYSYMLDGFHKGWNAELGSLIFAASLWVIFAVASINFYNFADGINGYVALFSILVFLSVAFFVKEIFGLNTFYPSISFAIPLVCALLSILKNNLWLNRVFMGDCGSTVLGLYFSFLTLPFFFENSLIPTASSAFSTLSSSPQMTLAGLALSFGLSLILLVDCTSMIIAKLSLGLGIAYAHRQHFYQRLSRHPRLSHRKATLLLFSIQLILNLALFSLIRELGALKSGLIIGFCTPIAVISLFYKHRKNMALSIKADFPLKTP